MNKVSKFLGGTALGLSSVFASEAPKADASIQLDLAGQVDLFTAPKPTSVVKNAPVVFNGTFIGNPLDIDTLDTTHGQYVVPGTFTASFGGVSVTGNTATVDIFDGPDDSSDFFALTISDFQSHTGFDLGIDPIALNLAIIFDGDIFHTDSLMEILNLNDLQIHADSIASSINVETLYIEQNGYVLGSLNDYSAAYLPDTVNEPNEGTVPETSSVIAWAGLIGAAGFAAAARKKKDVVPAPEYNLG